MPTEEVTLLHKLGEIPVLNDGWSTATDYYSRLKDYNALMRLTLSMAESSVKVAGQISTPVLNHYQPQIDNINDYACKKLDELEDKYPAIKQPTEQWKETCSDFVKPYMNRVKPVISQVQGIVDNSKQKIADIKTGSVNFIEGAKNCGVGTVTHVINSSFETAPGRFVTRTVDGALDVAEGLVDKYLPDEEDDVMTDNTNDGDSGADVTENEVEEMQQMDPTPKRVIVHAGKITNKIRRNMYRLAIKDLTYAKARTTAALSHMQSTVSLIDYAKTNLDTAKEKVDNLFAQIVKEDPATEKTVLAGTIEDRIVALGRLAARQVRSGVTAFEKATSELGQFSRNPISKTKEYRELIKTFISTESLQNFSSESLAKARASLKFIQEKFLSIVNGTSPMSWMAVDIDMEDIPLEENDLGMEQVVSSNNNSEDEMEREDAHI